MRTQNTIRLLNWNIQSGGGKRIPQIVQCISERNPDIFALTEFRNGPRGKQIEGLLNSMGYQLAKTNAADNKNTVAIGFRETIHCSTSKITIPNELLNHSLAIRLNNLDVIAVFGATPKMGRAIVNHFSASNFVESQHAILCGDFFFGARASNHNFGKALDPLKSSDWVNAWEALNSNQTFWSFSGGRGKSQPDHFFLRGISANNILQTKYNQSDVNLKLSDHASHELSIYTQPKEPHSTYRS